MGKISKLFNRFSKQQPSFAETGTNEQHHVDDEHEKEEKKVKENNSSLHEEEVTKKEQKKKSDGKAHIYNLIIVDESGSMSHLREVTLSGINETIGTIRNAQNEFAQTQVHTLTLVTFDSDSNRPAVRTMIDNQPIANVKKFRDYMPNGCTPLYDAMGQSLTRLHTLIKGDIDIPFPPLVISGYGPFHIRFQFRPGHRYPVQGVVIFINIKNITIVYCSFRKIAGIPEQGRATPGAASVRRAALTIRR